MVIIYLEKTGLKEPCFYKHVVMVLGAVVFNSHCYMHSCEHGL